jgi:hypothetical protein
VVRRDSGDLKNLDLVRLAPGVNGFFMALKVLIKRSRDGLGTLS